MAITSTTDATQVMQSQQELLIQVDSNNVVVGSVGKIAAHQGKGVLHRAFTAFLFDERGRTLITKRSAEKPLWPEFWDGACSSHQWFPNEAAVDAAIRRIPFELGITLPATADLTEIFHYEYHAVYSSEWAENEINSIVVGTYSGECMPNQAEVAEYRWLSQAEVEQQMKISPPTFAPWFKFAWDGILERKLIKLR